MQGFADRGIEIKSAFERTKDHDPIRLLKNGLGYHDSEPYALMIGDAVKDSSERGAVIT